MVVWRSPYPLASQKVDRITQKEQICVANDDDIGGMGLQKRSDLVGVRRALDYRADRLNTYVKILQPVDQIRWNGADSIDDNSGFPLGQELSRADGPQNQLNIETWILVENATERVGPGLVRPEALAVRGSAVPVSKEASKHSQARAMAGPEYGPAGRFFVDAPIPAEPLALLVMCAQSARIRELLQWSSASGG